MAIDTKQFKTNDWGFLGSAGVLLIFSFFPFYGVSYKSGFGTFSRSVSTSINAWHSYALFAMLLLIAAGVIGTLKVLGVWDLPQLPVGPWLAIAAVSALGALLVILRGFTYPTASGPGGSVGLKFGAYIVFVAAIGQAVFAFLKSKSASEPMQWGSTGGAAPGGYAPPPPPPGGYTPPPPPPPAGQ